MNQREVIRQIWQRRKKTLAPTPQTAKADTFFQLVDQHTGMCWEELVEEFHRNYSDATDEIVATLLETDDPLIIYNCIRFSDQNRPQEIAAMKQVARDCDCERHQVSLRALAHANTPEVATVLRARTDLPQTVRVALKTASSASSGGKKRTSETKEE